MTEYRARFNAEVVFVNGGDLRVTDFRIDLPSAEVTERELAELFVRHLGLALVDSVVFSELEVVAEQHKGSRGIIRETHAAAPATASARRLVDLSHTVSAGLVTYPGLPAPTITPHLTRVDSRAKYAPGTEFAMDVITMIGNTGTYIDSPFHRYEGGTDLAGLSLDTLVGLRAEVFHLDDVAYSAESRGIAASVFFDRDLAGSAVLLHTGWDRHFGTPAYAKGSPFLTEAGVRHLVERGVALVGIDALNIDDTESGGERPAHSLLLDAGIHVVEHLTNLGAVPARGARFTAVPPKVADFGTFPVRAFAEID